MSNNRQVTKVKVSGGRYGANRAGRCDEKRTFFNASKNGRSRPEAKINSRPWLAIVCGNLCALDVLGAKSGSAFAIRRTHVKYEQAPLAYTLSLSAACSRCLYELAAFPPLTDRAPEFLIRSKQLDTRRVRVTVMDSGVGFYDDRGSDVLYLGSHSFADAP